MVQHQDVQAEDDGRDAIVVDGVFKSQDIGDAVSTKKTDRLVAQRSSRRAWCGLVNQSVKPQRLRAIRIKLFDGSGGFSFMRNASF